MPYKIAVASTDGKVVNEHFGRAKQFFVLEVKDDGKYEFLEIRRLPAVCDGGNHDDEAMKKNVEALSDCRCVLVSQIGQGAETVLESDGINVYVIPDYIDEAVNKLISYNEIDKMIMQIIN